jgi:anti-sigma B factor antagonist
MALEKEKKGETWVLTPRKDLMGGEETAELGQVIKDIVAAGVPRIVVDLGRISYLNSTGLGALVSAHMSCQNRQGFLRLANISKRIHNLFIITKLAFVFETFDSVEEALAGVNRSKSESKES